MILKGSGTLYAHTDTDIGRDEIKTDGQQNYERHFAMDGESSSLDSIYTLKKIEDKKNVISSKTKTANNTSQNISQQDTTPSEKAAKSSRVLKTKTPWWVGMGLNTSSPTWYNYYMIALDGPRGANQFARIYGNDSIKSNSKIRQNTKGIATGFSVGSLQGYLTEGVIAPDERGHPNYLVETTMNGSFESNSSIKDGNIKQIFTSEQDELVNKLNSAKMGGETARKENFMPETETTHTSGPNAIGSSTEKEFQLNEGGPRSESETTSENIDDENLALISAGIIGGEIAPDGDETQNNSGRAPDNASAKDEKGKSNKEESIDGSSYYLGEGILLSEIVPGGGATKKKNDSLSSRYSFHLGGYYTRLRESYVGWNVRKDDFFVENRSPISIPVKRETNLLYSIVGNQSR